MYAVGSRIGQRGNLAALHVDAVGGDAARTEDALAQQALYHAFAVFRQTVVFVRNIYGDMNVKAHAELGSAGGAALERLWTKREGGMQDRKSTRLNSSHVKISYAV